MPRMRYVKPQFWSSPGVEGLDPWSRLLYIAMWTWADDFGRGTAEPRQLLGYAFPHDEIELADFRRSLGGIRRNFGVIFYKVAGRRYYSIPSWESHQKVDKRGAVRHPAPDQGEEYDPDPPDQRKETSSADPSETPPSSLRDVGGNSELEVGREGGKEVGRKDLAIAVAPAVIEPDLFDEFWLNYPRKDNKAQARKAWPKACKKLEAKRLVKAAEFWAGLWKAAGKDREHIPHASTWLNNARWNDEHPTPKKDTYVSQTDANIVAFMSKATPVDNVLQLPTGELHESG